MDCVFAGLLAGSYKPDPKIYLLAAELLGIEPHELMMTAATITISRRQNKRDCRRFSYEGQMSMESQNVSRICSLRQRLRYPPQISSI